MKRTAPAPWIALVLAAPLALAAVPSVARAQGAPPLEPPAPVAPPAAAPPQLPLPPETAAPPQLAPPPVQVAAPPQYAPPPYAPPQYAPPQYAPPYAPPQYAPPYAAVPPPPGPERSTSEWYGWQTLLAVVPFDLAVVVALTHPDAPYSNGLFAAGFVGRNVAPAVVHLAHGRPGLAFGSVGLHAAASATGLVVGYAIGLAIQEACALRDPCRNGFRDVPPGLAYGAVAGSMVGTVLDAVVLARRPRSSWESTHTGSTFPVTFAPYATARSQGLAAGGTF